ncbi:hypothetical protein LINPERHAP2_LOCUS121 [Linum perenne]
MAKNAAHQSPMESNMASLDQRLAMAKRCSHEGVAKGAKAAIVASIATAIPTVSSSSRRLILWLLIPRLVPGTLNVTYLKCSLLVQGCFHGEELI